MSMYFIRHGETYWNKLGKVQGITDIELTEEGIRQAKEAAISAEKLKLDIVISSPLKRALKTAEIISKHCKCELIIESDLAERNFGSYEGISHKNINWDEFWSKEAEKGVEGVEKCEDFLARIRNVTSLIFSKYEDKNVLLVSHGGFYKVICNIGVYFDKIDLTTTRFLENCEIIKI